MPVRAPMQQLWSNFSKFSGFFRLGSEVSEVVESTLLTLFPPRCAACDHALAHRPKSGLCGPCHEVLELNIGPRCEVCDLAGQTPRCSCCSGRPPAFAAVRAPYLYGGGIADLIAKAKFRGREELAQSLAHLLAQDQEARKLAEGATCLVPVPLGRKRRRQRGYNQSAIIARVLAKHWGTAVQYGLRRNRDTAPQAMLSAAARLPNVAGSFTAAQAVAGKVVLVDDVVTSAETARQAAQALREGGADTVMVLAVARAAID